MGGSLAWPLFDKLGIPCPLLIMPHLAYLIKTYTLAVSRRLTMGISRMLTAALPS